MADDIDIEEHDVMDNPAIKDMFPDLSVVKKEFGVEDSPTKSIKKPCIGSPDNSYFTNDVEATSILCEPLIKHFPIVTSTQLDKEYKPKLLCLDDEVVEAIEPKPIIEIDNKSNDSHSQFIGNKIIVGSRTAQSARETESKKQKHDAETQKCLNVKVVTEDLSGMLKKSKAFCFDCKTLLPNVKAYNAHKRAVHSYQHVVKGDYNESDQRSGSSLFDGNKFKCDICQYSVTRLYNLRRHYISKHQFEMPQELVSEYKTSKLPKYKTLQEINKMVIEHNVNNTATTSDKTNNKRKKPPGSRNKDNFCNHCSNIFSSKEELISHLYDILKQKTFQCPECLLKFDDQEQLDKHSFEHDEVGSVGIMDISQTKGTRKRKANVSENEDSQDSVIITDEYPKTSKKKKHEVSNEVDITPIMSVAECSDKLALLLQKIIPISTLFKCPSCCFLFMTYASVVNHESSCRKTKRTGKFRCKDCCTTFDGPVNYKIHMKQHLYTNEFNIIPVKFGVDLTKKILCHCPKCGVHYSENKFWSHYEYDHCEDDTPKSTYCRKCDILIDDDLKIVHSQLHQEENSPSFIFIDFEAVEDIKTSETSENKESEAEPVYGEDDGYISNNYNDYCYCNTCNCYFPSGHEQGAAFHANKLCQDVELRRKVICKQCGIMMTTKVLENHKLKHENQYNYIIFDSKFYDLNGEMINPPVPRFNYCGECKVFYILLKQGAHVCNRDSQITQYCGKCECTYSELAYSLHNNFHAYAARYPNNKYDDVSGNGIKYIRYNKKYFGKRKSLYTKEDAVDDEIDKEEERRLRYTFWQRNVRHLFNLFQCSTCDVMVTESNVAGHMNIKYNCGSVKDMYNKCEDCDFAIAGKDLTDHRLYHNMNPEFNRDQIKIIPFDKSMAVQADDIETVSEAEINSSDDEEDEDGKYIFYQCRTCGCNILKGTEKPKNHKCYVSPKVKEFQRQRKCGMCGLKIYTHKLARHYEWHKTNRDVTHPKIKIIKFENKETERKTFEDVFIDNNSDTTVNNSGDKLYQCKKCKLNYYNERVVQNHTCERKIPYRCLGCRYTFDKTEYEKHLKFHLNPNYSRASIKVIIFDKGDKLEPVLKKLDPVDGSPTKSDIATDSYEDVKKPSKDKQHVAVVIDDTDPVDGSPTKSDIVTDSYKDVKKPSKGKQQAAVVIDDTDPIDGSPTKLDIATNSYKDVKRPSKDKQQVAVVIDDIPNTEIIKCVEIIYKCSCGLHFLTKESVEDHNRLCGPKFRASKQNCTKCHLLFTPKVLFDHLMNHHGNKKTEFEFKVIEVSQMYEEISKDTLFACDGCKLLFISKGTMASHINRCDGKKYANSKKCSQCGLTFCSKDINLHEMKHHNKVNLEEKDFDIVVLTREDYIEKKPEPEVLEDTDAMDIEQNVEDDDEAEKREIQPCKPVTFGQSSYNNEIYRCKKCNLCYLNLSTFQGHCLYDKHKHAPKKTCTICEYDFTEASLLKHQKVHHDMLKLTRSDFIIKYKYLVEETYTLSEELKTKIDLNKKYGNTLYKCSDCVIYFMLENTVHKHVKSFHLIFKNTKQCNICKLNFSMNSLERHNYLHHEKQNLQLEDIEIIEYPYKKPDGSIEYSKAKPANKWNVSEETLRNIRLHKFTNKVYQCVRCDVNFVTKGALESHVNTQKHRYLTLRSECDVCGLKFLEPSLARHKYIHHENMKCQLEDLDIITEVSPTQTRKNKEKVEPKLYKCKPCDNHFMSLDTCKSHAFYRHEPLAKDKILVCDICNLKFLKPSLRKHKQLHHVQNRYTLDDLIIEEYDPMPYNEAGRVPPKVDIYIAADRANAAKDEYQEISSVENDEISDGDGIMTTKEDSLSALELHKHDDGEKVNDTPANKNTAKNITLSDIEINISNNGSDQKNDLIAEETTNQDVPEAAAKYVLIDVKDSCTEVDVAEKDDVSKEIKTIMK